MFYCISSYYRSNCRSIRYYKSSVFCSLAYYICLESILCLSKFQRYTISISAISRIMSTKILVMVIFQKRADSDKYTN